MLKFYPGICKLSEEWRSKTVHETLSKIEINVLTVWLWNIISETNIEEKHKCFCQHIYYLKFHDDVDHQSSDISTVTQLERCQRGKQ